jgi:hypothetical protein
VVIGGKGSESRLPTPMSWRSVLSMFIHRKKKGFSPGKQIETKRSGNRKKNEKNWGDERRRALTKLLQYG